MRIVQVVLSLGMGGQERLVVRIAHALRERGHDSHVVTLTPGGALAAELAPIPIHEVRRRDGFDPTLYGKLWRLFRALRPDVVHAHNPGPLIYAAPAARLAGVRSVVHTKHGNFPYPGRTLRLARIASRLVHSFVAVSAETAIAAQANERPPVANLSVIENGIPLGSFRPDPVARRAVRAELGIPETARVIGSVGRLVPDKDYPLLVRAVAPLLGPERWLVVVGEGVARPEIERAIASELPEDKRRFALLAGARQDVPRVLCAFDVFALSSRTEGLPLAISEAMTSGVPVVATAVGGVPGIVTSATGTLVQHGDALALRAALAALCDDDELRSAMGANARTYAVSRFAEERMLDAYLTRYRR